MVDRGGGADRDAHKANTGPGVTPTTMSRESSFSNKTHYNPEAHIT